MRIINRLLVCAAATAFAIVTSSGFPAENRTGRMLRDASLMLLKEGNARFVSGKTQHPNLDSARRSNLASSGQEPLATILACSDSRVPVELLFDRGIGDLFVVRTAGNVAGPSELASIEYGVAHLDIPVLVVLGHSQCGAVGAVTKGAELHGHLKFLAHKIQPAADKARSESTEPDERLERAIQANVWNTIETILRESEPVREKLASGSLSIVGATYDLETGKISWLGTHPSQAALMTLGGQPKADASVSAKGGENAQSRGIPSPSAGNSKLFPREAPSSLTAGSKRGEHR